MSNGAARLHLRRRLSPEWRTTWLAPKSSTPWNGKSRPALRNGLLLLFMDWWFSGTREGHALVVDRFEVRRHKGKRMWLARVYDPVEPTGPWYWPWQSLVAMGIRSGFLIEAAEST